MARADDCVFLDKAGFLPAIIVNGYERNTPVAVRKAFQVKGATNVNNAKGKSGATNVRQFIWSCPNPDLKEATVRFPSGKRNISVMTEISPREIGHEGALKNVSFMIN